MRMKCGKAGISTDWMSAQSHCITFVFVAKVIYFGGGTTVSFFSEPFFSYT